MIALCLVAREQAMHKVHLWHSYVLCNAKQSIINVL
jgi:hypothetical protein